MIEIQLKIQSLLVLNQESSVFQKLGVFALVALFAAVVYAILPKVAEKKTRGYYDSCELDEDEDSVEQEETKQ